MKIYQKRKEMNLQIKKHMLNKKEENLKNILKN